MAVKSTLVENAAPTEIFKASTGTEYAITTMVFCNSDTTKDAFLDLWVVPSGGVPGGAINQILKTVPVPAKETFVLDNEKLILSGGDGIYAQATPNTADLIINAMVSSVVIS